MFSLIQTLMSGSPSIDENYCSNDTGCAFKLDANFKVTIPTISVKSDGVSMGPDTF